MNSWSRYTCNRTRGPGIAWNVMSLCLTHTDSSHVTVYFINFESNYSLKVTREVFADNRDLTCILL